MTTFQSNSRSKVLIAGGGIGGLAAALTLLKNGGDCEVYEQAPALREVGAGLWLSTNGARVLFDLGLEEQLREAAIAASGRVIRLWNTGEAWTLYRHGNTEASHQPFLLLRAYLLQMLVDAVRRLKPDAIRLNSQVVGFEQDADGVTVHLGDGGRACGSALIGADGVHSKVREQLLGSIARRYTNAIAWRGLVPMDRLSPQQRENVVSTWVGPNAHITVYPVRWQDTQLLTFSGQVEHTEWQAESWSEKGDSSACLRDFEGWHPDVIEMISNVDTLHRWGLFVREPLPHWTEGRVTLLGDASHSMVPYLGQGVNMAIEDACVLARCLNDDEEHVDRGLKRYEAARLERTAKVASSAADMQYIFHNPKLASTETAGEYIQSQWGPSANAARFDWIYRYDATSVALH